MPARRLLSALRNLFSRRAVDDDLDAELRATFEMIEDERVAGGLSPEEARRAAQLELGGLEPLRARVQDRRAGAGVERAFQDLRGAVRWLRRSPGFAAAAILIFSLSFAAVTAVLAVFVTLLFRPPAGISPNPRLVAVGRVHGTQHWAPTTMAFEDVLYLREHSTAFSAVAAAQRFRATVRGGDRVHRVSVELATPEYFGVLGVTPLRGRLFTAADGPLVAVASERFVRRLGAAATDPGVPLTIGSHSFQLVGVTADAFGGLDREDVVDLWLPADARHLVGPLARARTVTSRSYRGWRVVATLLDGVSHQRAQANLAAVTAGIAAAYPQDYRDTTFQLSPGLPLPGRERLEIFAISGVWLAGVVVVVLIACTNIANLTLARALSRSKELAIRLALGASRGRVIRQLLTETGLLAVAGAALGLALARWLLVAIGRLLPADEGRGMIEHATIVDWRVGVGVLGVLLLAGLVAGLVPALQATRMPVVATLKDVGCAGPKSRRTRAIFQGAQVTLAVLLLGTAGLLVRTLHSASTIPLGFDRHGLVLAQIELPVTPPPAGFATRIEDQLNLQGELSAASVSALRPLRRGAAFVTSVRLIDGASSDALLNVVGAGYFRALGLPLLRGRDIDARDRESAERVVVVSESLARRYWPDGEAVGAQVRLTYDKQGRTIVGVVRDARHIGLAGRHSEAIYVPIAQHQYISGEWTLLLRPTTNAAAALKATQTAVRAVDNRIHLYEMRLMDDDIAEVLSPQRVSAILAASLGVFALLLTAAGIAATVSYAVAQRAHEIGIRVALGAHRRQILALVLAEGARTAVVGTVLGLVLVAITAMALRKLFVSPAPFDPVIALVVAGVLGSVVVVAGSIPARRAAQVDPVIALRAE